MTVQNNLHGLYVITDPVYCGEDLVNKVTAAISGGANIIQYRNKTADIATQYREAGLLAKLCKQQQRTFLINDDVELAIKVDADGVHLGQSDDDIRFARKQLGANKIIGITCHQDLALAIDAQQQGADYVAFGRFFPSQTKPDAPAADIDWLPAARKKLSVPVAAIGGITLDNAADLLVAGADMLAVIHAVMAQRDIHAAAKSFSELFNANKQD